MVQKFIIHIWRKLGNQKKSNIIINNLIHDYHIICTYYVICMYILHSSYVLCNYILCNKALPYLTLPYLRPSCPRAKQTRWPIPSSISSTTKWAQKSIAMTIHLGKASTPTWNWPQWVRRSTSRRPRIGHALSRANILRIKFVSMAFI